MRGSSKAAREKEAREREAARERELQAAPLSGVYGASPLSPAITLGASPGSPPRLGATPGTPSRLMAPGTPSRLTPSTATSPVGSALPQNVQNSNGRTSGANGVRRPACPMRGALDRERSFQDYDKVMMLNLAPILKTSNDFSSDNAKALLRNVALINHFAQVNKHILGAKSGLQFYAAVVGLTSSAKDVTAAQLLELPELAVTGENMTTAAPEYTTILERDDNSYMTSFQVHFRGKEIYAGESADACRRVRLDLMNRIRAGNNLHTSDPITILIRCPPGRWPSYTMNTIGMMPRAGTVEDPIYRDLNNELNEQASCGGGVLVICHGVKRPLDATASFLDLDVVKSLHSGGGASKFLVAFARTMADLLTEHDFEDCHDFKAVHHKIFGAYEEKLPGVKMFLVTGWPGDNPANADDCRLKFEGVWNLVKQRIISTNPGEATSKWLLKLDESFGTNKLVKYYHSVLCQQGQGFVNAARACLTRGQRTLQARLMSLKAQKDALTSSNLGDIVIQACIEIQQMAGVLRTNSLDRPSTSLVELDAVRAITRTMRQTLSEEYDTMLQMYGNTLISIDCISVSQQLAGSELEMNNVKHHAFWARFQRLKANARTFARLYQMPPLSKDEINAFTRTSTLRNTSDCEHFIMIHVLDKVKAVFQKELVPLFANWLSHMVHSSYVLSVDLVLGMPRYTNLKENAAFSEHLKRVLDQTYKEDVRMLVLDKASKRQISFAERISIERTRRETMYENEQIGNQWKERCATVSQSIGPTLGSAFKSFLTNVLPSGSLEDSVAQPPLKKTRSDLVNENPSVVFNPKMFLKLQDNESTYLNEVGRFLFSELLVECIFAFFREAEAALDFLYTESRVESERDFLFKRLYFLTKEESATSKPELLKHHEAQLQSLPSIQRYKGLDFNQLLQDQQVSVVLKSDRCPDCGNASSDKYCGASGQLHPPRPAGKASSEVASPFTMIDHQSDALPDFTYGRPAADVPGYREPLHGSLLHVAKDFIGKYFDDKADRASSIVTEAHKCMAKFKEYERALQAMPDTGL